jgi:hypothetical protein
MGGFGLDRRRAASGGPHRSARQTADLSERMRKQLVSVATKRRAERTKAANLPE